MNPKNKSEAIIVDYNVIYLMEIKYSIDGTPTMTLSQHVLLDDDFGYNVFWHPNGKNFGVTG